MTLSFTGVFADARAMWRGERALLLPLAGMFFLVPMLAIVLLLANSGFPGDRAPEQMSEAVAAFYAANLVPLVITNIVLDFGTFAVLNLFLQGGGRTLGEVLLLALRRFLPFLAIDIIGGLLFSLGLSLLVLPGLLAFARTWLAAPAFAANPERGPIEAFREGWRRSGGWNWLMLLVMVGTMLFGAGLLVAVSAGALGGLSALLGDNPVSQAATYLVTAAIGAMAWTALAVLRVAAYRASEPRQGI